LLPAKNSAFITVLASWRNARGRWPPKNSAFLTILAKPENARAAACRELSFSHCFGKAGKRSCRCLQKTHLLSLFLQSPKTLVLAPCKELSFYQCFTATALPKVRAALPFLARALAGTSGYIRFVLGALGAGRAPEAVCLRPSRLDRALRFRSPPVLASTIVWETTCVTHRLRIPLRDASLRPVECEVTSEDDWKDRSSLQGRFETWPGRHGRSLSRSRHAARPRGGSQVLARLISL